MSDAGDIHLADLNVERRRHVLVVSNRRFNRLSERVLVVPEITGPPADLAFPWWVEADGVVFAVDLIRSIPGDRLLDRTGRAPASVMGQIQRTLARII